jgi:hypothetical protein
MFRRGDRGYKFGDLFLSPLGRAITGRTEYEFGDFVISPLAQYLLAMDDGEGEKKVPGPTPRLFVENLPDLLPDFWTAARNLRKEYGDFVKLRVLGRNLYICSNPIYLQKILEIKTKHVPPQEIASEGVFLADGEKWQFARNILQGCFIDRYMESLMTMFLRLAKEYANQVALVNEGGHEEDGNENQNVVKLIHFTEKMMVSY